MASKYFFLHINDFYETVSTKWTWIEVRLIDKKKTSISLIAMTYIQHKPFNGWAHFIFIDVLCDFCYSSYNSVIVWEKYCQLRKTATRFLMKSKPSINCVVTYNCLCFWNSHWWCVNIRHRFAQNKQRLE